MLGEAFLLVVWGLILFPEGSLLNKILWTIGFCGILMSTLGGVAVGWMCFTARGREFVGRWGW